MTGRTPAGPERRSRSFRQRHPRHPAEVTAIRLAEALEKWPDRFNGLERDGYRTSFTS